MIWLKLSLAASLIFMISIISYYFYRFNQLYHPNAQAKPKGSPRKGKIYSLSLGLLPWEKESTRQFWPTYVLGIVYHLAIALAFLRLLAELFGLSILSSPFFVVFLLMGTISGLGLFFRRWLNPALRSISLPDDYLANLLVDFFLFAAAMSLWQRTSLFIFYILGLLLALYIPFGKIRHCFFFIPSRLIFGDYYGRKGLFPPPNRKDPFKKAAKAR
ncbi:MAG: hypothetical protein N3B16_12615 [Candidatus Aminicenantes bacterium]|nr:hypothetical protein [Candidatus Aminicenantes bacterium]